MSTDVSVPAAPAIPDLIAPWISHACEFPADQQAVLVPSSMTRRHPWLARRPEYSGYCVISSCECECHQAQPGELAEEVRLDVFES